jgi:hypothetical protein
VTKVKGFTREDIRPPQPDEFPTRGEDGPFRGTNPWSGPYFVIAILGAVVVVVVAIVIAFVAGLIQLT